MRYHRGRHKRAGQTLEVRSPKGQRRRQSSTKDKKAFNNRPSAWCTIDIGILTSPTNPSDLSEGIRRIDIKIPSS